MDRAPSPITDHFTHASSDGQLEQCKGARRLVPTQEYQALIWSSFTPTAALCAEARLRHDA